MKLLLATACVVGVATAAHAGVWDDATASAVDDEAAAHGYQAEMDDGDQSTRLAASQSTSASEAKKLVKRAVRAYERAAALRPDLAEPHWRAAQVMFEMQVDCPIPEHNTILCDSATETVDPPLYRAIIAQWEEAERLDPLDPRIKPILFERALLRTKLATDEDLAEARDDYEALLDFGTSLELGANLGNTRGNLSETYMMLGDLDHAIASYLEALLIDNRTAQMYGLAVAYDRDEQGAKAKEIIAALGTAAAEEWEVDVELGGTFYVPDGEVFYYKGLVHESLGHDKEAVIAWKRYLESGAHPAFQPRARDHLDKLKAKLLAQAAAKAATVSKE